MKKVLCLALVLAVLMVFGCGKPAPEDVAKDYIKKQFTSDFGTKLNTSTLKYNVVKLDENNVIVKVSGNIYYEEAIKMVKDGGNWKLKTAAAAKSAAPAEPAVDH